MTIPYWTARERDSRQLNETSISEDEKEVDEDKSKKTKHERNNRKVVNGALLYSIARLNENVEGKVGLLKDQFLDIAVETKLTDDKHILNYCLMKRLSIVLGFLSELRLTVVPFRYALELRENNLVWFPQRKMLAERSSIVREENNICWL